MTFAWWTIDAGAEVPEHAHPHEQVVNVLEGELALTVDGTEHVLRPGDVVAIPGGVRHAARALRPAGSSTSSARCATTIASRPDIAAACRHVVDPALTFYSPHVVRCMPCACVVHNVCIERIAVNLCD